MATTDTRSGFRLPWSSDRSSEEAVPATATDDTETAVEEPAPAADPAWPETDFNAALGLNRTEQRPASETDTHAADPEEPEPMVDMDTAVAAAPAAAPRKPTKLMADLSAAIRATAEAAREQALAQVETDVQAVVNSIREGSTEGAVALKRQSEEDVASIREWSKAEIARIREETEGRIAARKATLEDELAGHAAAVDRRVDEVRAEVSRFEAAMAAYLERINREQDPARLATMAEELPEAPSFEAWADLENLDITLATEPVVEAVAAADAVAIDAPEPVADAVAADAEPDAEGAVVAEADDWGEAAVASGSAEAVAEPVDNGGWNAETNAWTVEPSSADGDAAETSGDDVPRWAAGETPDGFPAGDVDEAGDPVDRGAIMAALEAAAEAVVAAESAAESADQAEAAADVAETAAELLVGRSGPEDDLDPEARDALNARVDAGGYETESFQDRLASLLPNHGEGAADDAPRTTQVVVTGLVSVASIASFKRHLGRLAGVQNVAVASGPEGEFVFNLTHRADLSFRDAIPTMPGFAARVTSTGDGVVNVTARDPEAEG